MCQEKEVERDHQVSKFVDESTQGHSDNIKTNKGVLITAANNIILNIIVNRKKN